MLKIFLMSICLFFILKYINTSASTLNNDLLKIQDLGYQCKMLFNPDRSTQAQEFVFTRKTNINRKPLLSFKNAVIEPILIPTHLDSK